MSLAWVGAWIARFPEQRAMLIQELIQQRERQLMLYRDMRDLIHVQIWSIGRSLLMMSVTIFSLLLTAGALAELARLFQRMEEFKITLPATVLSQSKTLFDFGSHLPSSPVLEYAARLPFGNVKQAALVTLGIILVVILLRSLRVYRVWLHARTYKFMIHEIKAEIAELRALEEVSH